MFTRITSLSSPGSGRALSSLAQDGRLWISGTHHVIFSVGYGLQELGAKILNVIVWEETAPPPNLSCR